MVMAMRVHETGGSDALTWEKVDVGEPGPGEARIRHTAIGLNFIDIYFRSGLYPAPNGTPFIPGNEGAGIVETVGANVSHIQPGDRVAYVGPLGAYAQERIVPADRLVAIPDGIDDKTAAAMMLKGMTAQYLLRQTYDVGPETTLLFHAAAGGVGLIAGQWAGHLGATVIGTAGSPEKVELAKANGYQHVINYRTENFVERIAEITGGRGCDVVYDSVGQDTYPGSLDCLKPRGLWVSFGQSSGPIKDFNLALLGPKGSLYATRPTLFTYIASRADLEKTAGDLFDVVKSGIVKIDVNQEYRLADAKQAHDDLEGRKTTGTTVLIP
ncbi:NADPH2:quinone reductase [Roseibium hamelinense]|uniref:NADPH2:quinone reductase n=1 Tax=Roseibium hamelinense TaxID=150831 RepID=A0A562TIJ7_9HYPH|nr:quinone oxidoreductase [Roseibium hamelinense]MTI45809.1 quinone oxidoreductase [Roseibium hamelinense]TWI93008.1 NADPH2:quinone reductase [Roseibium hamelinense]